MSFKIITQENRKIKVEYGFFKKTKKIKKWTFHLSDHNGSPRWEVQISRSGKRYLTYVTIKNLTSNNLKKAINELLKKSNDDRIILSNNFRFFQQTENNQFNLPL